MIFLWKFELVLKNMCSMRGRNVAAIMACLLCHVLVCKVNVVSESTASGTDPLPRLTRYPHMSDSLPTNGKSDKPPRIENDFEKMLYIVGSGDIRDVRSFKKMYMMFKKQLDDMSDACYDLEHLEEVHVCMSSRMYTHLLPQVEDVYYHYNQVRSDFLLNDLKVLVIKMVSKIQFECCYSTLLQKNSSNYCEECEYAQTQQGAISVCMHSMISDKLSELRSKYVRIISAN